MAQVAANADLYAGARLNKFFDGVTNDLDGQCVSLVKWFMQQMTAVPNPQAPRGDARYVGKTLVAQGHAIAVPYAERRRGDLICYEFGTYGHIGVVLSGNRTFEENVKWTGVASKIVNGSIVYASRIGSLSESWRHDKHIYRLKTYKEITMSTDALTKNEVIELHAAYFGTKPGANYDYRHVGHSLQALIQDWKNSPLALKNKSTYNPTILKDKIINFIKGA